jgi:hypothetical protein
VDVWPIDPRQEYILTMLAKAGYSPRRRRWGGRGIGEDWVFTIQIVLMLSLNVYVHMHVAILAHSLLSVTPALFPPTTLDGHPECLSRKDLGCFQATV